MKKLYLTLLTLASATFPLAAQTCWTGGTGTDGAFTATSNTTLAGGTYNFTTFTINAGVTVAATGNQPLIIHCTGAVTIDGTLQADGGNGTDGVTSNTYGTGGIGVAGGDNGGDGAYSSSTGPLPGIDGLGNGGYNTHGMDWSGGGGGGFATYGDSSGMSTGGYGGPYYGNNYLSYTYAGSGGGGGSGGYSCGGGGGGAGGGYLSLQSAVSITIGATGMISAKGGNGGSDGTGNCGGGGGGSGGALWIVAPSFTNNGIISAAGGIGGASMVSGNPYYGAGANGSDGYVRIDYNSISGSGSVTPAATIFPSGTAPLSVSVTTTPATCFGSPNGTATANVTGGGGTITYIWGPSAATTQTTMGQAGQYVVFVSDSEYCTVMDSGTITEPPALTGTITGTDETSSAANDGSATVTISGGTPGYTYSWAPSGGTSATATGLDAGTYTCIVTDANGCALTQTVTIGTLSGITVNSGGATVSIFPNPSNGPLQINVQLQQPEVITISVVNLLGETVLQSASGVVAQQQQTLDLSSLPNGMYMIRVAAGNDQVTRQVLLQQ